MKYVGALGTVSWFDVVVLSKESYCFSVEYQYEGALRTESWFDVVVFWEDSKFFSVEYKI